MNHYPRAVWILALSLAMQTACAHDLKEHAREAAPAKAGPDCAAMNQIDAAKMDPNDPVMKAMMARCGDAPGHAGVDHLRAGKPAADAPAPDGHGGH